MKLPDPRETLPEFMAFIDELDALSKNDGLHDWDSGVERILRFFTPEQVAKIETVIPHWQQMSSYGNGITCAHVTLVVLSTLQLPEYQSAGADEQILMLWASLFHDVEKILVPQEKDHIHGFRSAVTAARALPILGFATKAPYLSDFEAWADFTWNAICPLEEALENSPIEQGFVKFTHQMGVRETQDNRKLPKIIEGIDTIFETPAATIIKSILLHMSIDGVNDYPHTAALSDEEIRAYISPELYPFVKVMHLVDCDGWAYFDPELKNTWRSQTLNRFMQIRSFYHD